MLIDEKSDTEIPVWDWVRHKLNDDLELSLRDNEAKNVATECFREFGVNFPGPNVPPRRITFFSNHGALGDTVSAQIIQKHLDRNLWHIWVECTQVAAVWTLFQIQKLLQTNRLRINFSFTTGHELVKALLQTGPEEEPHFAVITSAPVHGYNQSLNYQLMSPIHLERQQVFQKKGGVLNRDSRVYYLGWSTAAAQLKRLSEREDDPALRELTKAKPIPSFSFSEFVSWVRKMKGGDCTVLWKPPLWGLNRDNSLVKISHDDFRSPISLYRRCHGIEPPCIGAFSRLFASKWQSSYTAWKANPTEAFNQFKALIEKWDQTSDFLHSFRLAAGAVRDIDDVQMGIRLVDAKHTVIVNGKHYPLTPRQYDVLSVLANAKKHRLSLANWSKNTRYSKSQPPKVMQQIITKYRDLKPFYHSAGIKGRGYGFF